jgi:hypothetical protein
LLYRTSSQRGDPADKVTLLFLDFHPVRHWPEAESGESSRKSREYLILATGINQRLLMREECRAG